MLMQICYYVRGYFYMLTAYDLPDYYEEEEILEKIAAMEGCEPEDIQLLWDTAEYY